MIEYRGLRRNPAAMLDVVEFRDEQIAALRAENTGLQVRLEKAIRVLGSHRELLQDAWGGQTALASDLAFLRGESSEE